MVILLQGLTDKNLLRKGTFSLSESRGQAMEQREQKPSLLEYCRVVTEEDKAKEEGEANYSDYPE